MTPSQGARLLAAACRLAGMPFAARLVNRGGTWRLAESWGLDRGVLRALAAACETPAMADRLERASVSGRARDLPAGLAPQGRRSRLLPAFAGARACLLVGLGEDGLTADAQRMLRGVAEVLDRTLEAEGGPRAELWRGIAVDLDAILEAFRQAIACDAADLAVRWGDRFRVAAMVGFPEAWRGHECILSASPLEARLVRQKRAVQVGERPAREACPVPAGARVQSWLGAPLIIGERVIGRVGLARRRRGGFEPGELQTAERMATELAPMVEGALLFQEATRRLARLAVVQELAPLDATLGDAERIVDRVLSVLQRTFSSPWAFFVAAPSRGVPALLRGGSGERGLVAEAAESTAGRVWARLNEALPPGGAVRVVRDRRGWVRREARALVGVAVRYANRLHGFLLLEAARANAYGEDDERLLAVIAGQMASLLENSRLYHEMEVAVGQLSAARQTALDLASQVDHPAVLDNLAERIQDLLDVPAVELGLLDAEQDAVRIVVSRNPWEDFTGTAIGVGKGLEGKVAKTGRPVKANAAAWWESRGEPPRGGTAVCLPLLWGDEAIGVVSVMDDSAHRTFSPEDMRLLELLAPQAAITLRNARLVQDLRQQMGERKRTEAQLVQSAKMAAVGQMAAGIAHEVNNPLTTVAGFTELWLEEMAADDPLRAELELVAKEARRARAVVSRLLDFARQRAPRMERSDVNAVVREGLDLVRHLLALHGVELQEDYGEGLPWAHLDPSSMKQVLLNLVHNAIQAMPEGGRLTIRTSRMDHQGASGVAIAVEDSGVGIPPEHLKRMFEPFFTTKSQGEGTGLGLAVSYGLVAEHGGRIEVDSRPGEGSVFRIWLPLAGSRK